MQKAAIPNAMENQCAFDGPYMKHAMLLRCSEPLHAVMNVCVSAIQAGQLEYGVTEAIWESFLETIHPDDRVKLLEEKLLQETTGWSSGALTLRMRRTHGDYVCTQIHAQFGPVLLHCVCRTGSADPVMEDRGIAEGGEDACSCPASGRGSLLNEAPVW